MKTRWLSLICALLLAFGFSCGASALIAVENETGIHYSTEELKHTGAVADVIRNILAAVSRFWHRFGVVTIIVLLVAAIVIAIVISEVERQKKEKRPEKPAGKKKKKE